MNEQEKEIRVSVTFKNTDPSDSLKQHAIDKFTHCVQKLIHQPETEISVVFAVEKSTRWAEVNLHADGADFHAKEESADLYKVVDRLCDSLSAQLRKHKEKKTAHH